MARAAATERAMTSRAGLDPTAPIVARGTAVSISRASGFRRLSRLPCRDPIAMLMAERARCILGERVAVALLVGRPQERGHDLEIPVGHVEGLAPEVGETEVDVELEQVDPGRALGHADK